MTKGLFGAWELEETAKALLADGRPFALATVVFRRPPVSAHLGDRALVTAEGRLVGWIGGSCSQEVVRQEALAALRQGEPRLVRLGSEEGSQPGRSVHPMRCPSGGEMEVYIEPHGLAPRLWAFGDTPLVRALARLAEVVGLATQVVEDMGAAPAPEDWRASDCAVVASAGAFDEEALARALAGPARYVALVASRRRAEAVREVLAARGFPAEVLGRIRSPAGLDIGARTQEEIALSVLAELIAEVRRMPFGVAQAAAARTTERDPVCGMEVAPDKALSAEVGGTTYYFCCPHCQLRFVTEPERFLARG